MHDGIPDPRTKEQWTFKVNAPPDEVRIRAHLHGKELGSDKVNKGPMSWGDTIEFDGEAKDPDTPLEWEWAVDDEQADSDQEKFRYVVPEIYRPCKVKLTVTDKHRAYGSDIFWFVPKEPQEQPKPLTLWQQVYSFFKTVPGIPAALVTVAGGAAAVLRWMRRRRPSAPGDPACDNSEESG